MDLTTPEKLAALSGSKVSANLISVHEGLKTYGKDAGLHRPHRLAMFLAHVLHETGDFRWDKELWGPTPAQKQYDTRTDLGNTPERDGDGFKNRGRGPFHLTGGYNIRAFHIWCQGRFEDVPEFPVNPDLINTDPWEGLSAIWYWDWKDMNITADTGDFRRNTIVINGGTNGLRDREKHYGRVLTQLAGYTPDTIPEFQRSAGLGVDGVVGPMTRGALHRHLLNASPVRFNDGSAPAAAAQGFFTWLFSLFTNTARKA